MQCTSQSNFSELKKKRLIFPEVCAVHIFLARYWQGLTDPQITFVFAGCLFEQQPADSSSLFTLLNISWRMNTRRMRDRVNIAVKIKR